MLKLKTVLVIIAAAGAAASIAIGSRTQFRSDPLSEETSETSIAPAPPAPAHAALPTPGNKTEPPAAPQLAPAKAPQPSEKSARAEMPAPASPETDRILRAAAAAYENVHSLKASFVQQIDNPLIGTHISSEGTLYQQKPDLLLLKFSQPSGDLIVSDGQYFWIYYPSVDAKQVIRAPVSAAGDGGVDLQAQFLGDPVRRFNSTLDGRETIGGRSTYAVTMMPRERRAFKKLKVWIDTKDSLARRFEITEENGNVRRFELHDLHVNAAMPPGIFHFAAPPHARVIERG
jgi:outer membrane lipoprotein-sorting protein